MNFVEEPWFILAMGAALVIWSAYLLLRAWRTGNTTAVGDLNLEAAPDDPTFWRWSINVMNVAFFVIGLWIIAIGLGL